jgi:hypothetical protein
MHVLAKFIGGLLVFKSLGMTTGTGEYSLHKRGSSEVIHNKAVQAWQAVQLRWS